MITAKKISKSELLPLIHTSYNGDGELLTKYHIKPCSLQQAVFTTMMLIDDTATKAKLSYYKVIHNKQAIGYFVTFENFLYSFGISMKHRKKEVLQGWWQSVKKVLGNNFQAGLYQNNTRAIEHLKKQGMVIIETDAETKTVTLQLKK